MQKSLWSSISMIFSPVRLCRKLTYSIENRQLAVKSESSEKSAKENPNGLLQLARKFIFATPLLFWGCASQFAALQNNRQNDIAVEELRIEVADLKHALHAAEVEIHLLEEKLETPSKTSDSLATLQHKLAAIEKNQGRLSEEIRTLSAHAHQTTSSLSQYRDQIRDLDSRFEDLGKIKNTLSSISKSIRGSQVSYKVKAGDSLEKIARHHRTSVEAIKQVNHLQTDRITIGQELIIPNG